MKADPRWRETEEGALLRGFVVRRDLHGLKWGERLHVGYWSEDDQVAFRSWAKAHYCMMFSADPASLFVEIERLQA